MYRNAVANNVTVQVYLGRDFYNIFFKTNMNHIEPQVRLPSNKKILDVHLTSVTFYKVLWLIYASFVTVLNGYVCYRVRL